MGEGTGGGSWTPKRARERNNGWAMALIVCTSVVRSRSYGRSYVGGQVSIPTPPGTKYDV